MLKVLRDGRTGLGFTLVVRLANGLGIGPPGTFNRDGKVKIAEVVLFAIYDVLCSRIAVQTIHGDQDGKYLFRMVSDVVNQILTWVGNYISENNFDDTCSEPAVEKPIVDVAAPPMFDSMKSKLTGDSFQFHSCGVERLNFGICISVFYRKGSAGIMSLGGCRLIIEIAGRKEGKL